MAYSVLTPAGLTINIKAMLEAGVTIDEVNRQLRGSRGVCLQCLLARRQLTQAQAEGLGRGTLQACLDSSFRCGHRRRKWNAQTGAPSTATVTVEPHYFHPEPLLGEGGERIQRPCESRSQAHIAFLDWLLGSQRAWCLDGLPDDRSSLVLRELRYRKAAPNWRAPDLAVVRCLGVDPDKLLAAIQRDGYLPEHATQTISAIELQLSRISVQEIRQRTNDHARHFEDTLSAPSGLRMCPIPLPPQRPLRQLLRLAVQPPHQRIEQQPQGRLVGLIWGGLILAGRRWAGFRRRGVRGIRHLRHGDRTAWS